MNWGWLRRRLLASHRHRWVRGDSAGARACVSCGVWRWPLVGLRRG